jgi:hypothetical protein
MAYDDDFRKQQELFMNTVMSLADKKGIPNYRIDPNLANDVFSFIWRQISDFSNKAKLNEQEYQILVKEAVLSLNILVFVTNYSDNILEKEPLYVSGKNLLCLKYSEVFQGRTRELIIEEIKSRQQVVVSK